MKKIESLGLICFLLLIFGCSNTFNISATDNKVTVDARDGLKFESVVKKTKKSVILLSVHPNVDPETDPAQVSMCSGVVADSIGHIITNYHCVHKQNYIKLYYYDKNDWETYDVNVVGLDPLADLALLQVLGKEKPKSFLKFADDAGEIQEGAEVFAMGHPMGMAWTLTKGIVSSNERYARHPYIKAIQTDAAINKGNSGGPLLNMKGEIVGINAMIVSRISESAGVGLAIRGDIVKKSFESMLANGKVDRPAVGVMVMDLTSTKKRDKFLKKNPKIKSHYVPNTFGLFIEADEDISEGLKKYDTIIAVNDVMINNGLQFSDEMIKYNIGDTITLTIIRKRRFLKVDVPVKVLPVPTDLMYDKKNIPTIPLTEPPKKEKG